MRNVWYASYHERRRRTLLYVTLCVITAKTVLSAIVVFKAINREFVKITEPSLNRGPQLF